MTQRRPSTFILLILMALASVGAVLFTPAIPEMQRQFHVSTVAIQWTVSIFIIGYALGQLIYGPISNRFGRKPTLFFAVIIAIIGSMFSGYSGHLNSFSMLIVSRFIMAIGASAGLTLSFTIINDVYSMEESRQKIAYVSLAFAILPGLAIFVGGFIVKYFPWEACFYFLAFYYAFAFMLCCFLPETSGIHHDGLHLRTVAEKYWEAIKSGNLWVYTSMWGVCTAIVYIFSATAPIIGIVQMELAPNVYGMLSLVVSIGLLLGGLSAAKVNKKIHYRKVILLGTAIMCFGALMLFLFSKFGMFTPLRLFSSSFIMYYGMSFVFSNAAAMATQLVSDKASASSMMSFLNMMFAVLGLALMGVVHGNPEHIMPEVFLVIMIFQSMLLLISRRLKPQ